MIFRADIEEFLRRAAACEDVACLTWPFARTVKGWPVLRCGSAARVVCEKAHGSPPSPQHEAAHRCGRGGEGCVNGSHLRWATKAENEGDKVAHGTHNKGSRHGYAKLDEARVREIRLRKASTGECNSDIAEAYGVSRRTVDRVVRRERWTHV